MKEKETKSSRRFDAEESPKWKFFYDESPGGKVIKLEGLRLETPLRAMRRFLEALYFSLHVNSYLEHTFSEK